MRLLWDFKELTEFSKRLNDMHKFADPLMAATREIARVLHGQLLNHTPIDTGNLRKMWSAGDNLLFTVNKVAGGYEVVLINKARRDNKDGFMYGIAVNDGHSTPSGSGWVMGRFFVEKSILVTSEGSRLEQIIYKELQKWWDSI